jgi:hypothetical protein
LGSSGTPPVRVDSPVTVSNGFFEADQNASGLSLETGDEQRP